MKISTLELRQQAISIKTAKEKLLTAGNTALSAIGVMNSGVDRSIEYNLCGKVNSICTKLQTLIYALDAAYSTAIHVAEVFEGTDAELKKQVENMDNYLKTHYPELFSDDAKQSHSSQTVYGNFKGIRVESPGGSGPCNMAAIANMLNRKRYIDGEYDGKNHIKWDDDISIINGDPNYAAQWTGNLEKGIREKYGYNMTYDDDPARIHNLEHIKDLCRSHPEGILVYAKGNPYYHGVVLSMVGDEFWVTDSATYKTDPETKKCEKYSEYEKSWMATDNGLRSVEDLIGSAINLYYIGS